MWHRVRENRFTLKPKEEDHLPHLQQQAREAQTVTVRIDARERIRRQHWRCKLLNRRWLRCSIRKPAVSRLSRFNLGMKKQISNLLLRAENKS